MMKKIIVIVASVLVALLVAGGTFFYLNQKSDPASQFVGSWYDKEHDVMIEFKKDNSLEVTNDKDETKEGTWKVAGKYIKFTIDGASSAKAELPEEGAKGVKKLDFKFDTAKTLQSKFLIKDGTFEKQK